MEWVIYVLKSMTDPRQRRRDYGLAVRNWLINLFVNHQANQPRNRRLYVNIYDLDNQRSLSPHDTGDNLYWSQSKILSPTMQLKKKKKKRQNLFKLKLSFVIVRLSFLFSIQFTYLCRKSPKISFNSTCATGTS